LYPELGKYKLTYLTSLFGLTNSEHRAKKDCIATKELYDYLFGIAQDRNIDPFKNVHNSLKPSDIQSNNDSFDESHPFYKKTCVFTGALHIPRRKAWQAVVDLGGLIGENITQKTDYLIVGSTDYIANLKGNKSSKLKKAEALIQEGHDISILTEDTFFNLLSSAAATDE
jgi:hypothetical protein